MKQTRKEILGVRPSFFSKWVRTHCPDSWSGYMVADVDFVLWNYQTRKLMLLEEKRMNKEMSEWHKILVKEVLHPALIKQQIEGKFEYLGFHLVQFENTSFADGHVYFDNELVSEDQLKAKLTF